MVPGRILAQALREKIRIGLALLRHSVAFVDDAGQEGEAEKDGQAKETKDHSRVRSGDGGPPGRPRLPAELGRNRDGKMAAAEKAVPWAGPCRPVTGRKRKGPAP